MPLSDEEDTRPEFFAGAGLEAKDNGGATAAGEGVVAEIDDEDIGDVNLDELGSKVWLVKVPTFLAERWKQPRDDGVQLGKMRIYDKPDDSGSNISIILNDSDEYQGIPREYRMQVTNEKVRNMHIFSEDRDPTQVIKPTSTLANRAVPISMTGTVRHECTITPNYTDEYKRIMRKRVLEQHMNSRRVQTLEPNEIKRSMLGADATIFDTAPKKPKVDTRMARMERQDLMNTLFACFKSHPYWSLKGLVEHTRQPLAYLKEVLGDIAKLNKSGSYTNTYSLKPEFNKAAAAAAPAPAAGAAPHDASAGGGGAAAASDRGGPGDDMDDLDNIDEEDDDFEDV
ncbi:hypothetical protein LPJ61_005558 [Coemansia biformis]|uniref:Transcription initiation factor IIF subunit beta n=1 Tax=Coemansia biformis TaxID=1286918 RepID=A0A9W8CW70_9FUNG|nr:hypothetical protein LPJ61_005558 [Coemansia biformis]